MQTEEEQDEEEEAYFCMNLCGWACAGRRHTR